MSVDERHADPFVLDQPPTLAQRLGRAEAFGGFYGHSISRRRLLVKRGFDLVLASIGLVVASPLLAAIAIAIKVESPGPVFFRQRRYGLHRNVFMIWKFRSMEHTGADTPFRQASPDDERVTRVGRFLRRTNLDELPQLLNVLNGTMSLVGPRPHPTSLDEANEMLFAGYDGRFAVKPGITGWAQVNGFRGATITDEAMKGRIEHDLFYVEHCSLWIDLKILLLTFFSAKSFENAY